MKSDPFFAVTNLIFSVLLRVYPSGYRQEFAEEMREVFAQAARDASRKGPSSLAALFASELLDFPASAFQAHLRVRRAVQYRSKKSVTTLPAPAELSWRELLLALSVFLLPGVMLLINQPSQSHLSSGWNAAALFLVIMVAAGFLRGTPLRSLPYFGVIMAVAGYLYLFQWIASLVSPALISNFSPGPWDPSTYLLLKVFSNGMLWLMLFCLTLLVVALLALFNRFQPLFNRVHHDWTLLSYILYGESVFALLFLFESYRYESSFAVASLLCLAAGGWLYLRSDLRRRRILSLIGGLTLAVWVAALGTWLSLPGAQPSLGSLLGSQAESLDGGTARVLLAWLLMVIALLLPGMLARLPVKPRFPNGYPQAPT